MKTLKKTSILAQNCAEDDMIFSINWKNMKGNAKNKKKGKNTVENS